MGKHQSRVYEDNLLQLTVELRQGNLLEWYGSGASVHHPGQRGPQKAPTKRQVTLRLDRVVLAHFRRGGSGW